ncbi:MAG: hypothetical protein LW855_02695 [Alphaproteobacteria bacterium]|jgi:hypothetical protein|nr:hypothetical protein [Thalassospira sp.]MCE2964681.1 hypothetical protein [Alphaproteobacteria bacterium]
MRTTRLGQTLSLFSKDERGNALFLILLAIVLFAGLSYAVTQTGHPSRSARLENELIASSQLTQFGNALRLGIDRMQIAGIDAGDVLFVASVNAPEYSSENNIFNPKGFVGLRSVDPAADAFDSNVASHADAAWIYRTAALEGNGRTLLPGVGSEQGADRVLVLTGISSNVCRFINQRLGLSGVESAIPPVGKAAADFITTSADLDLREEAYMPKGQPFLCVRTSDQQYVYYHVLSDS